MSPGYLLPIITVIAVGCAAGDEPTPVRTDIVTAAAVAYDSMNTMSVLLRQFQQATPEAPDDLSDAATSRDELVQRWARAVEHGDTSALVALRVTRAEFAHLFFPTSIYTTPLYELDPAIVWMQIDAESDKAVGRTMRTYGGRPIRMLETVCGPNPQTHGESLLWGCDIRRMEGSDTTVERLFGAILERRGQFKFLSLGNKL